MSREIEQVGLAFRMGDHSACWVLPAFQRATASSLKVSCTMQLPGQKGESTPTLLGHPANPVSGRGRTESAARWQLLSLGARRCCL